jgi:hypothetical protein
LFPLPFVRGGGFYYINLSIKNILIGVLTNIIEYDSIISMKWEKVLLYLSVPLLTIYSPLELTRVILNWGAISPEAAVSLYFPLWVELAPIWWGYIIAMVAVCVIIFRKGGRR